MERGTIQGSGDNRWNKVRAKLGIL
jgi:hypothetical protein